MKDLELRDIFPKKEPALTRMSVQLNGRWVFATPTQALLKNVKDGVAYFRMTTPFGILRTGAKDPSKTVARGPSGWYLARKSNGEYYVLPKDTYDIFFPKPVTTPKTQAPTSSKALKSKDFYTNVVKDSPR